MLNKRGITLVELLVVIAVIGALIAAAAFTFTGWQARYNIESQAKTMYMDLMNARTKAMQKNRKFFAILTSTSYSLYEDVNPAPDGDGDYVNDPVLPTYPKTVTYPINWTGWGLPAALSFDKSGLVSAQGTIWFTTTESADYDCIVMAYTRINLGKWNASLGSCDVK